MNAGQYCRDNEATPVRPILTSNGVAREQVRDIQRRRMLSAMVELVAERGVANVTVAQVVERAGVSRRTFYEVFGDRDDCFLAAFDECLEWIYGEVLPAYERPGRSRGKIRGALVALLSAFDGEPALTRLLVVESLAGGPATLERRARVVNALVAAIDEIRRETNTSHPPHPMTAEGVVGGVLALIHTRLLESDSERERLIELTNPLMSMIVLPYLGAAAARRELERPLPKSTGGTRSHGRDPLRDVGMRLTYRTVRVLAAVGANPGASNREIAETAGIEDQGQISKLLTRLQNLELLVNTGAGQARGAPNAWTLTDRGAEVRDAIAVQTDRS